MTLILIVTVGILLGFLVFIRPSLGLMIILLSTLFLPEVPFGAVRTTTGGVREILLRPEDFFLILVALGWLVERTIRRQKPAIISTPLNLPIIVFSMVMIFTTLLGVIKGTTTPGAGLLYTLKRIQYFIVFFLVISNVRTLEDVKRNINLLFLFAVGVALWGIVEYFLSPEKRIVGPFMRAGQPPILGGFFLIIIFLAIGFFMKYQGVKMRLPMLIIIILSFLVIIFTKTRSSYVGVFVGLIIFSLVFRKPFLLVIPILLIILMQYIFPAPVVETIHSIRGVWQQEKAGVRYAPSWDARVNAWESVLPQILSSPIIGHGHGSYALSWVDNQYIIDVLYMGILGLVVFIWLLVRIFGNIYPLTRIPPADSPVEPARHVRSGGLDTNFIIALSSGYLGSLIALLIHGIAVTTFYTIRTMVPFWFLSGLVMVAYHLYYQRTLPNGTDLSP